MKHDTDDPDPVVTWESVFWDPPEWYQQSLRGGAISQTSGVSFPQISIVRDATPGVIEHRGDVTLTVQNFNAKRLERNIRFRPPGGGPETDVPPLPAGPGEYPTRWDMDLTGYFNAVPGAPNQFITLRFVLADPDVAFLADKVYPISLKNSASRSLMVNARFEGPGRIAVVDMLFRRGLKGIASCNIALLVNDTEELGYNLPILIDPRVRNVG